MQTTQQLIAQFEAGQVGRAWAGVKKALKKEPRNVDLLRLAGVIAKRKNQEREAIGFLMQAVKAGSTDPRIYDMLSVGLYESLDLGRLKQLRTLTSTFELSAIVDLRLASAYWRVGKIHNAMRVLKPLLGDQRTRTISALNLAGVLARSDSNHEKAIEYYEEAIKLDPNHADFHSNLSGALMRLGYLDKAREHLNTALSLNPSHILSLERSAILSRSVGKLEEAYAFCTRWLEIEKSGEAAALLLSLESQFGRNNSLEAINSAGLNSHPQVKIELSKINARNGEFDKAGKLLLSANKALARKRKYDVNSARLRGNHARSSWLEHDWVDLPESPSPKPIFVLGVARSGTTLLERMLGSDDAIVGLGEIGILDRSMRKAFEDNRLVAENDLVEQQVAYEKLFQQRAPGALSVVDKMPINMRYAGFLKKMFPSSALIHMQRHPNDVATSLFETYFESEAHNYSYSEAGIEEQFEEHIRQVAFWVDQGIEMLTVDYEDLVTAPEAELKRIAAYCDMQFTPSMLHPERNDASIQTASVLQARKPVNKDSIGRWSQNTALSERFYCRWREGWPL